MSRLDSAEKSFLAGLFGDRITFEAVERKLYGHDIAAIPGVMKPLIGDTTPDAVVQPQSEQQLAELVKWAAERGIPLTPRGKATSGYGGVIPVKNGIVVDFHFMRKVLSIDKDGLTASVEPGISWEQLDREIMKQGLTLRLYPTSYPSSTVGGWLAQGGAGIGSFEFGWFKENVVSARVVLPGGEVRELSGPDLDLVSDAEGSTGIISRVTVRIRPLEKEAVTAIACPNAHSLQGLIDAVIAADLPIWSMVYINPRMAEMKNKSPLREHNGHPAEEHVTLPVAYILTLAYREADKERIIAGLVGLVKTHKAEILPDKIAEHEWEHRFQLMIVKRLGPSLVPSEVVVPLQNLGKVMDEIEEKVDQPVVKEGVIIKRGALGRPEAVILGFIPSDQRKFSYGLVFGLVLTIMKIAEKHGGRPYSTGMYFARKSREVLGAERVKRIKGFKDKIDPKGVLNPDKVIASGVIGKVLSLAGIFEPLIRVLGNRVVTRIGELPEKPARDIPAEVAWYAYACSQCGYCVDQCAQFYGRGWESQSPRGKWYWLREYMEGRENWDQRMVDTFIACTTCEMCDTRCSASLPVEPSWMKLRGVLIHDEKRMTFPPFEMMKEALASEGNIWAAYRKDREAWFPDDLKEKHGPGHKSKNVYFAGCTASYIEKDVAQASVRLLDSAGVDFTYLGKVENCCGTPMKVAGKWAIFDEVMKKNVSNVKAAGADTVITSCPACDMMWRHAYPARFKELGMEYGIKARHYSEAVAEKINAGEFSLPPGKDNETVTWHDSCHIGRASGIYEPPRDLIRAIPNVKFVEMEYNHEKAHCCGSAISLLKAPEVAGRLGKVKVDEAVAAGAEKILALCPCCEFQLRVTVDRQKLPVEIQDLARFAASKFGYEFEDPNPEVRRQWAVFEAFVALMTPKGFAELMGTMWPEMIDAMPFGMGSAMRLMGKVPGALNLMKPLFPVLFPRLLPMMMPKVMPVMLNRVAERIPMPGYMLEQMPDLMPKVMDSLMPHMIDDVVPLVSQPMINYLQGKAKAA